MAVLAWTLAYDEKSVREKGFWMEMRSTYLYPSNEMQTGSSDDGCPCQRPEVTTKSLGQRCQRSLQAKSRASIVTIALYNHRLAIAITLRQRGPRREKHALGRRALMTKAFYRCSQHKFIMTWKVTVVSSRLAFICYLGSREARSSASQQACTCMLQNLWHICHFSIR